MTETIVAEGAERGHAVKVCTDPTCTIHFADRREPDAKEIEKQKEQRRKELLKRKLEATVRHRTLAEVLKKVGAPLERTDLLLVLQILLDRSDPVRRETLARRYKLEQSRLSTGDKVRKELQYLLRRLNESGLSKLLLEWVLLDDVERISSTEPEYLNQAARQHRVDMAKVRKSVEQELQTKQAKVDAKRDKGKPASSKTTKAAAAKKSTASRKAA